MEKKWTRFARNWRPVVGLNGAKFIGLERPANKGALAPVQLSLGRSRYILIKLAAAGYGVKVERRAERN